jgi:hypothetical protein
MKWVIYELYDECGNPVYVGLSYKLKRRLKEHRASRRPFVFHAIVETLDSETEARAAEVRRIALRIDQGFNLQNLLVADSERETLLHTPESRGKMSAALRGKKKPEGFGARLSAVTKGRPHNVPAEKQASMARTQFKKGHQQFQKMPPEKQESIRESRRRQWDGISAEDRSRMATERNRAAWAKRTPEERAAIGRRIADARARNRG